MGLPKVIFAAGGAFAEPSLRRLLEKGYPIELVVTQPDRPAGRGRKTAPTPIARLALERNLPLLRTADINLETLPSADVMVVIAFGQKIAPEVINRPRMGSINLHASILPKCRGAAPIQWAIIRGETVTGNSIIRLARRMDAGAILAQSRVEIGSVQTAGELHDRLAEDGADLLLRTLEEMEAKTAVEREQDEREATAAPKLSRADARLDWTCKAKEICRLINGLSPWPGCHARVVNPSGAVIARLTLLRARAVAGGGAEPGRINAAGEIDAADGAVELLEVQPEGKRVMTMREYRNGYDWPAGAIVESA